MRVLEDGIEYEYDPETGNLEPASGVQPAAVVAEQTSFLPREDPADFDGATYSQAFDRDRLTGQIERVFDAMADGAWLTLTEIQERIRRKSGDIDPHASISAQLRHLRKPKFGAHSIDKRARGARSRGLYEYRLTINERS